MINSSLSILFFFFIFSVSSWETFKNLKIFSAKCFYTDIYIISLIFTITATLLITFTISTRSPFDIIRPFTLGVSVTLSYITSIVIVISEKMFAMQR